MDFPELRKIVRELDALDVRRAAARARALALVPLLEDYAAERGGKTASLQMIADRFNRAGIPAAQGGAWSRPQVQRLLQMEADHGVSRRLDDLRQQVRMHQRHMPDHAYTKLWVGQLARVERQHNASLEAATAIAKRLRALVRNFEEETDEW